MSSLVDDTEMTVWSRRLILRRLRVEDVTDDYVHWLNEPDVNRFLEARFTLQTRESVEDYVRKNLPPSSATYHFGVFERETGRLIGTVTFNQINQHHRSAAISFVIGHPEARGKGYGVEAVHAATFYMLKVKGFVKLWGGYYDGHVGSEKVFLKNGYAIEGRLKKQLINYKGDRVDHVLMGLLAPDFRQDPGLLKPAGER